MSDARSRLAAVQDALRRCGAVLRAPALETLSEDQADSWARLEMDRLVLLARLENEAAGVSW